MNKWVVLGVAGWMAAGCTKLMAAETNPFPPGDVAWTVEVERKGGEGMAPHPVRYEIQRKGEARQDKITWSNGGTTERWWYLAKPTVLMETALNGSEYFYSPNETSSATVFDASMFNWLRGLEPQGEEKWKGRDCIVFRGEMRNDAGTETRRAWIDKKTGRPAGLEAGGSVFVFSFGDAPPLRVVLPPKLVERADLARKIIGGR